MLGNLQGVQMVMAHEVYHKPGWAHRAGGTLHMLKNLYMHFSYQHLYVHHRKVSTPEDAASAPQGITVYEFVPRSFLATYRDVYRLERDNEKKRFWTNYAVLSVVASVTFTGFIFYMYNLQATVLFLIQTYLAIFFLEAVNYLEHYGLARQKLPNGEYEKVTIRHSWNAPHRFTNYLLFKLQRHSDHHENSLKPYQTLLTYDESPQLPHGYGLVVMTAFIPKVWFGIMDPLVESYKRMEEEKERRAATSRADLELKKFWGKMALGMFSLWAVTWLK
jgi:alkane 1-monooxygenase